jgi:hypothetical protein
MPDTTVNGSGRAAIPASPKSLKGTPQAILHASVILETLSGLRTTGEASEELGFALTRYYQLETRALQGMIDALEPRKRGRKRQVEDELQVLRAEAANLRKEMLRYQALHRVAQRALALSGKQPKAGPAAKGGSTPGKATKKKVKKATRRRRHSRGERVLGELRSRVEEISAESRPPAGGDIGVDSGLASSTPSGAQEVSDGR